MQEKIKIGGTLEYQQLIMVAILSAPNKPGIAGKVLGLLGSLNIPVEFITESANLDGKADITFCVHERFRATIVANLDTFKGIVDACSSQIIDNVAIIAVYGPHFREKPAIAARFCSALGQADINILGISTSISSVSCVIAADQLPRARQAIETVFALPE